MLAEQMQHATHAEKTSRTWSKGCSLPVAVQELHIITSQAAWEETFRSCMGCGGVQQVSASLCKGEVSTCESADDAQQHCDQPPCSSTATLSTFHGS